MSLYGIASSLILLGGLIPAAWFAVSWGRRMGGRIFTLEALDAGGWVYGLLAVYSFQTIVYMTVGIPEPTTWSLGVARIMLGLLLDLVIVARALAWRRLRNSYRRSHPQSGENSDPAGGRRL